MSTEYERDRLTELALIAWADVAELLRERGERWPHTGARTWGIGLHLVYQRAQALEDALAVLGGLSLDTIARIHEQRRDTAAFQGPGLRNDLGQAYRTMPPWLHMKSASSGTDTQ